MIIGEKFPRADMEVNVTAKRNSQHGSSSADEAIRLIRHRELSLEQAIEFIADDEFVKSRQNNPPARKFWQANKRPPLAEIRAAGSRQLTKRIVFRGDREMRKRSLFVSYSNVRAFER